MNGGDDVSELKIPSDMAVVHPNDVDTASLTPAHTHTPLAMRTNEAGGRDNITAVVAHFRAGTQLETGAAASRGALGGAN